MLRAASRTQVVALCVVVIVATACDATSGSATPAHVASPSPVGFAPATAARLATVAPTEAPARTPRPTVSPKAGVTVGTIVSTVVDGLRVRSQPRVSDDSIKLEPLLPLGATLYVLDGPEAGSGYAWYEVAPVSSKTLPIGWVASTDRDGEPWIETGAFECPLAPTDFRSLARLPAGVGLACFPQVPITVEARLVECNCDADGSWFTPSWFFLGSGSPTLLVDPDASDTTVSMNPEEWFALNLDPNGEKPDVLPVGEVVEVTGMFDHPAAAGCTRTEMDGEPAPTQGCRLEFAVTKLVARP
jgi:hypothetical protein